MSEDEQYVPRSDYDELVKRIKEAEDVQEQLNSEVLQLREALKQVNQGIHKASEMVEGIAYINDKKLITDLAFTLMKHHPKQLTIKYKGEIITEIFEDQDKEAHII
jgi:tetrahydromethanopterin S-methyltransferase subunit G